MYNDIQEQVAVHMCGFDGVQRGKYFRGESIRRIEVEVRVGKLKNQKASGKDEITGEMIKSRGDRVVWGKIGALFMPSVDFKSSVYKGLE